MVFFEARANRVALFLSTQGKELVLERRGGDECEDLVEINTKYQCLELINKMQEAPGTRPRILTLHLVPQGDGGGLCCYSR